MSRIEQAVITGGLYTIEPSEAFQGIEPGIVEVLWIGMAEGSNYTGDIKEYITTSIADEGITKDTLWVAYMYTDEDGISDAYVLPIEVFKEHTTAYIPD